MFQFLGSKSQAREEKGTMNTPKVSSERPKSRYSDTAGGGQGFLQRPALVHQQQQQQHNSENMVTLHAKLLQEAEKIRKWKIQTELDLKEKERKMTEAQLRIETMKKSILELQLQNEKTSAKLEEEITNKEEVLKRIDATREMCNLLKSHASSVIDRLTRCETEKTELKYSNKEQTKQFQELIEKFKSLKIQVTENRETSKRHADKERLEQLQREESLKEKLHASEEQIQDLELSLKNKTGEIQNLETLLQSRLLQIETLELSTKELQNNVSCLSKELEIREAELKDSALRIAKVQDEKSNLEKKIQIFEIDLSSLQTSKDDLTLQMTESTTDLERQLQLAQDDAHLAKSNLEEEQKRLMSCEKQLLEANSTLESLKSARDALLMEKKDAEINEDLLKFQINNLMTEKEENQGEIHNLNGEISNLSKKLERESLCRAQIKEESDALQEKISVLEHLKNENGELIISLKKELNDLQTKVESLESLLSEKVAETTELQEKNEIWEQTVTTERQKVKQLEDQIKDSDIAFTEKADALQQKETTLDSLKETIEAMKLEKGELEHKLTTSDTQIDELRCSVEDYEKKIEELTEQLEDVNAQQKEWGKNLTAQQKKAAGTAKINKDLEKEIKALKSKLEKETKDLLQKSDQLNTMQTEVLALREVKKHSDASLQSFKEEMETLKLCCEKDQKEARLAMEKAKEIQLSAEKEKENAQALTDCQLTEMMSTLETYKQNNEKLITEKDLKIEELRAVIENQKSEATKYDEEKHEWSCELDVLKIQVTSCETEKEKLAKEVASLLSEKDELKNQVAFLKNQMSTLKLQVVQKTQEKHTPLIRNTGHLSTPVVEVTPQKQQPPSTPQPVTPNISTIPKTPSRSILRLASSEGKRRKVAFVASNSPASSSEDSDLMELDPEAALYNKSGTPLLFTPNLKVNDSLLRGSKPVPLNRKPRGTQMIEPGASYGSNEVKTPLLSAPKMDEGVLSRSKPVSRGRNPRGQQLMQTKSPYLKELADDKAASNTPLQQKPHEQSHESEAKRPEVVKTPKIRTAPAKETKYWTEDCLTESNKSESLKTSNVRKTPAKKSKFFSTSPRVKTMATAAKERGKGSSKDTTKMDWFDLDSVYGFGPED